MVILGKGCIPPQEDALAVCDWPIQESLTRKFRVQSSGSLDEGVHDFLK